MFELPEAKRVRREDLNKSDDSEWGDASDVDEELQARLNAQIAKSLGLDVPVPSQAVAMRLSNDHLDSSEAGGDAAEEPEEEEGYSFRLFSTAGPAPKVVLEDPDVPVDGGLIKGRPLSYYLAPKPSALLKSQYEFAAVTGEDVIARSRVRSWGLELPWKLTTIKVVRKAGTGELLSSDEADAVIKRKRPGKKRRLAMRMKDRAKVKAQEAAKRKEIDKEEHIKEKKKRMNRLKKLRKRAKKKGEKGGDGGDSESGDDSSAAE